MEGESGLKARPVRGIEHVAPRGSTHATQREKDTHAKAF